MPARIRIGIWVATPALNLLEDGERSLRLEPKAMDVLAYLAARAGQVVSVEELLREVWRGVVVTDASVYMAIKQLRRALAGSGDDTRYVETIPKRGYRLTALVEHLADEAPPDAALPTAAAAHSTTPASEPVTRAHYRSALAATGVVVALIAGAAWLLRDSPGRDAAETRGALQVFELTVPGLQGLAVSPDGRHLAYVASTSADSSQLYLRSLDSLEAHAVPGTEGAVAAPFWSPDSRHIAYGVVASGGPSQFLIPASRFSLARVARDGGAPEILAENLHAGADGAWSPDGVIVFDGGTGLERIAAATGGERRTLTQLDAGENAHVEPSFLPDGKRFIYTTAFGEGGVYVQSLDGGARTRLLPFSATAVYASGYLLFNRGEALLAQKFDANRLTLQGEPQLVADGLKVDRAGQYAAFSVSANGVLAYVPFDWQELAAPAFAESRLVWYSRSGERLGTVAEPGVYRGIALSPDATRIAVHRHDELAGGGDLWLLDEERGTFMRFTDGARHETNPVFSRDGRRLVYAAGDFELYQKPASGTGAEELKSRALRFALPSGWAGDDAVLVTHTQQTTTDADISAVPLDGGAAPVSLESSRHNELGGVLSPDGRWLAYASDETGTFEVYVVSYPDRARKLRVSTVGGEGPQWADTGELFFFTDDGAIWSAAPAAADAFAAPQTLFAADLMIGNHFSESGELPHVPFAVTRDGQRFLINERVGDVDESFWSVEVPLVVMLNWTAALDE